MDTANENPNPLSPDIQAHIDDLARQVSVGQDLDAGIQAELAGHIADKVKGYLSGEEKVTPADALLLAEAHFGDPQKLNGLLHRAWGRPRLMTRALANDLAGAGFAFLMANVATFVIALVVYQRLIFFPVLAAAFRTGDSQSVRNAQFVVTILTGTTLVPMLCLSLWLIRRSRRFVDRSPITWALFSLSALAMYYIIQYGGPYLIMLGWHPDVPQGASVVMTDVDPAWHGTVTLITWIFIQGIVLVLLFRSTVRHGNMLTRIWSTFGVYLLAEMALRLVKVTYGCLEKVSLDDSRPENTMGRRISEMLYNFATHELTFALVVILVVLIIRRVRRRHFQLA